MTARHDRLLYLGNAVVDLVMDIPALPERGGDVLAVRSFTAPGGGFNVMAAAARQGLSVIYAGAHGTGPFGDRARAALRSEGVDVLLPPRDTGDTGYVMCLVDGGGERTFVTSPGAEATLGPADLDALRPTPRDLVCLSGYSFLHDGPRTALTDWLSRLDPDVTVLVDPGPLADALPAATLDALTARADWWSCNDREATLVTGLGDPSAAALALQGRLVRGSALVRTGPDGCLLHDAGIIIPVPGFRVRAVDLNGAGDAHVGTFLAALAQGRTPTQAARRANAAAALAVTRHGPATAPDAQVVDTFLASHETARPEVAQVPR